MQPLALYLPKVAATAAGLHQQLAMHMWLLSTSLLAAAAADLHPLLLLHPLPLCKGGGLCFC
jgi:hypothetical protein